MRTYLLIIVFALLVIAGCDSKPAPSQVRVPMPDGSMQTLPPGASVSYEIDEEKGSALLKHEGLGSGVGAGLQNGGDEAAAKFNASAPNVWTPDGWGAAGGDTSIESFAKVNTADKAVRMASFWVGIGLILLAGGLWKFGRVEPAIAAGTVGVACVACAFFPGLIVLILLVALAGCGYAVWLASKRKRKAEEDAKRKTEALRGVAEGVEKSPPEVRTVVKSNIAWATDNADKDVIRAIKKADDLPSERH